MKGHQNKSQNNVVQSETFAAKLSIIGAYISTLGEAVATMGEVLDLQYVEEQEETTLIQQSYEEQLLQMQRNYEEQLLQMQRQIDSLSKRISRLERRGI